MQQFEMAQLVHMKWMFALELNLGWQINNNELLHWAIMWSPCLPGVLIVSYQMIS